MTDKEKIHQILSSLWKNDDSVGKTYYNQALQDAQTAMDLQEKPVSEDLDVIAREYAGIPCDAPKDLTYCVHDKKAKYDAVLFGAQWQKQQMIKNAFPAEIGKQRSDYKCVLHGNFFKHNAGDKVKLIII